VYCLPVIQSSVGSNFEAKTRVACFFARIAGGETALVMNGAQLFI
jgi:hypothetical protein